MQLYSLRVAGRHIPLQRSDQSGKVRRAASAGVPPEPFRRRVLRRAVMTSAQLQRVGVEELPAAAGGRHGDAVVERPLHLLGVLAFTRRQKHPPVPLERSDGGASFSICAVRWELVSCLLYTSDAADE